MVFHQRPVGRDKGVDAVKRHQVVAVGARHLFVDFRDDDPRRLGGGLGGIARGAERAKAMRVRRRELEKGDVELDRAR